MYERSRSFIKRATNEALGCAVYGSGVFGELLFIAGMLEKDAADSQLHRYESSLPAITQTVGPVELTANQKIAILETAEANDQSDNGEKHMLLGVGLASAALVIEGAKVLEKLDRKYGI